MEAQKTTYSAFQLGLVPLEVAHQIRVTDALTQFVNDAAAAHDYFFDRLDKKRAELLGRPHKQRASRTQDSWSAAEDQAAVRATFDEVGADQYIANLRKIRDEKLGELRGK